MTQTDPYLKWRGGTASVRVQIPRPLWGVAGKREFVKALGTGDRQEANRLKHGYVAAFFREIEALKRGKPNDALAAVYAKAAALQTVQITTSHPDGPESVREDLASEEAERIEDKHGEAAAVTFFKIATGQARPSAYWLIHGWLSRGLPLQNKLQATTVWLYARF
jgi:hypothetical protein